MQTSFNTMAAPDDDLAFFGESDDDADTDCDGDASDEALMRKCIFSTNNPLEDGAGDHVSINGGGRPTGLVGESGLTPLTRALLLERRDAKRGLMDFRGGSEEALLLFVKRMLGEYHKESQSQQQKQQKQQPKEAARAEEGAGTSVTTTTTATDNTNKNATTTTDTPTTNTTNTNTTTAQVVLRCVDVYCYSTQWMMHAGDKKVHVLRHALEAARYAVDEAARHAVDEAARHAVDEAARHAVDEAARQAVAEVGTTTTATTIPALPMPTQHQPPVQQHQPPIQQQQRPQHLRLRVCELGAYCGYSAVLIGSLLQEGESLVSVERDQR
jgi:hypothetical protein